MKPTALLFLFFCEALIARPAETVLLVGDLQRTSIWERMIGREQNDAARRRLVGLMSKEQYSHLIMLGDLVFYAADPAHWRYFDKLTEPLRSRHLPIQTVLGNHEYYGSDPEAMRLLYQRFPRLKTRHWASLRLGKIAFLLLDSNRDDMPRATWLQQHKWYAEQLATLHRSKQVRAIVVVLHHPPYTNSTVTSDEAHVQRAFIPSFLGSPKSLLMVAGHVHTYERFSKKGKTFINSGGGGGPRVTLIKGKAARHIDQFNGKAPRPFHYLRIKMTQGKLLVEAVGFAEAKSKAFTFDRVLLSLPK